MSERKNEEEEEEEEEKEVFPQHSLPDGASFRRLSVLDLRILNFNACWNPDISHYDTQHSTFLNSPSPAYPLEHFLFSSSHLMPSPSLAGDDLELLAWIS
ncbi:hypothetical protein E2C01_089817 [Portunus trituberculatus]|uniref:Uncharacterized protein n=1 Tax=Portunus trituberculatus TaxID=210409 RepID=A0A5B7JII7_PORTR|nr:hypothetical protein [Portunus trituberculatus]